MPCFSIFPFSIGRSAYTPEEDVAILSYVSKHITEIGGNKIWQEMAKNQVTSHSWQSMKSRYKTRLAQKQPAFKETETAQVDQVIILMFIGLYLSYTNVNTQTVSLTTNEHLYI